MSQVAMSIPSVSEHKSSPTMPDSTTDPSASYFAQRAPNPPFFTSLPDHGMQGPDSLSSFSAFNAPMPTEPTAHFRLALQSAAAAANATPGIPHTPFTSTPTPSLTLNLPGKKSQSSSISESSGSFHQRMESSGMQTPRLENLNIPKRASFFGTNDYSPRFSIPENEPLLSSGDAPNFRLPQGSERPSSSSTFDSSVPYVPVSNASFSRMIQHHKFRSPSLPVNSIVSNIEIPSDIRAIDPEELATLLSNSKESTLVVDVRPFNQYSTGRISSAVNICIPSTLLKRPTFSISRFAECMIPYQRGVIDHLDKFQHVIIYDQATMEASTTVYSPIVYTLLKFHRAEKLKSSLSYLKGGFTSFQDTFPSLIDDADIAISDAQSDTTPNFSDSNNINSTNPKHLNRHSYHHGHSASQPHNTAFNFPPVLTGFSLPINSTRDGPLKPFASNIRNSLEHADLEEPTPISLPSDLDPEEIQLYFPLWLQDIINKDTGPRHVTRRFYDIEQAEKVRLQSAFNRGSRINSATSPSGSPVTTTPDETGTKYSFSAGVELGAKNRYTNIWPYDHTRVKLPEVSDCSTSNTLAIPQRAEISPSLNSATSCDYFNASYITAQGTSLRYIATQAPLPDTFNDFWHVVWGKKIPVVVMLTAETEGGSIKCHRYWDNGIYGSVSLKNISTENVLLTSHTGTSITVRKFLLTPISMATMDGTSSIKEDTLESHTVIQMQYTAWPDLGSPANPEDLISLCNIKNSYVNEWKQQVENNKKKLTEEQRLPWTLVHCSAGCGRTGTFCTVDSVINLLEQKLNAAPPQALRSPRSPFHSTLSLTSTTAAGQSQTAEQEEKASESRDLIYRTVHNFRRQRLSMVQVLRQYVLCYETVILWMHLHYLKQRDSEKQAHRT